MIRWLLLGCVTACGVLGPAVALAQTPEGPEKLLPPTPSEPTAPPPVVVPEGVPGCHDCAPPAKTLSVPTLAVVEQLTPITVPRLIARDEPIGFTSGLTVNYVDKTETVIEWVMENHPVTQPVVVPKLVPHTVTDCNGHCHTEYEWCEEVVNKTIDVYEAVPRKTEIVVRVPKLETFPLQIQRVVIDTEQRAALESRMHLHAFPNEVPVAAPSCPAPILPEPFLPH
jgi:hypothetical protein